MKADCLGSITMVQYACTRIHERKMILFYHALDGAGSAERISDGGVDHAQAHLRDLQVVQILLGALFKT